MRTSIIIIIASATLISAIFMDATTSRANVSNPTVTSASVIRIEIKSLPKTQEPTLLQRIGFFLGARGPLQKPESGITLTVQASGYAPSPYQTDSTPCITAAGTRVRRGTVAANFLPLGTLLKINDDIFIVEDRMNPRYQQSIDIFFPSTSEAVEFGRQKLDITIIGYGEVGQELSLKGKEDTPEQSDEAAEPDVSFLDKALGQFNHLRRVAKQALSAKSSPDINYYDVDCFRE